VCKIKHTGYFLFLWSTFFQIFKLVVRLRTSEASMNRDWCRFFFWQIFWQILLTNFVDEFFDEFFFGRFLLTYNLLTIASFRIGVPSILFNMNDHVYLHIWPSGYGKLLELVSICNSNLWWLPSKFLINNFHISPRLVRFQLVRSQVM
jgi:hypothetical protein